MDNIAPESACCCWRGASEDAVFDLSLDPVWEEERESSKLSVKKILFGHVL